MENMGYLASVLIAGQIAAALAVFTAFLTAIGQGNIAGKAVEAIARQPEAKGAIGSNMIIGMALAETGGVYGLVIAMILLFANPLVGIFTNLM